MTKIAIISQPEQGVLIDIGGCSTLQEATQHLTYTLQVSSQFWVEQAVDLNLGQLSMTREELAQVLSTLSEVGVRPRQIFAEAVSTRAALRAVNIVPATGKPATFPQTQAEASLSAPATAHGAQQPPVPAKPAKSAKSAAPTRDTISVEVEGTFDGAAQAVVPPVSAIVEEGASPNSKSHSVPEAAQMPPLAGGTDSLSLPAPNPAPTAASDTDSPASEAPTASACAQSQTDAVVEDAQAELDTQAGALGKQQPAQENFAPDAVLPKVPPSVQPHVLYLRQTLRSGQAISHKGHLVIIGDVNPGAEVIADGDITIWGALRGVAHAGVGGNTQCEIRALKFDPIQLRIAHAIARSPDRPRGAQRSSGPEIARIVNGTIRIAASVLD